MRFALHSINDGLAFLTKRKAEVWAELQEIIRSSSYQMQACAEQGRTGEPIFSPSMNNLTLSTEFLRRGWASSVRLLNPTPASGRDIDYHKAGVVAEVQFAHYGLLQGDLARMDGLYSGGLSLCGDLCVECGVEIVANRAMPTSQGVARADQAVMRAAPLARTIPVVIVDILAPDSTDLVDFHANVVPRARRPGVINRSTWGELLSTWKPR